MSKVDESEVKSVTGEISGTWFDKVESLVLNCGLGQNPDTVSQYGSTLIHKIQMVTIDVPLKASGSGTGRDKLSDASVGRALCEAVDMMINCDSECFTAVIETGFDINDHLNNLRHDSAALQAELETLKYSAEISVIRPEEKIHKFKHEIRVSDFKKEAFAKHNKAWSDAWKVASASPKKESKAGGKGGATGAAVQTAWKESEEYQAMEEEIFQFETNSEDMYKREYVEAFSKYEIATKGLSGDKQSIASKEAYLKQEGRRGTILDGIRSGIIEIVGRIRAVGLQYPGVGKRMEGRVKIPLMSGGFLALTNPLSANNLTGMKILLFKKYHNASLVMFAQLLLELLDVVYTDASVGTAVRGRSVIGHMVKLNDKAGAVMAKSTATLGVHLSSFESELDGTSSAFKSEQRVKNTLTELRQVFADVSDVFSDNVAMIEFVRGEGVAKGVRHMELRMWALREKYKQGNLDLRYMEGVAIPADKLTKLGDEASHTEFVFDVMGLGLLPEDFDFK